MDDNSIQHNVLYREVIRGDMITIYASFETQYASINIQDDPNVPEDQKDEILTRIKNSLAEKVKSDYTKSLIDEK